MDKPKRNYSISKIPVISPRLIQLRMGFWVGFPDLEIRREARSRGAGAGGVAGLPKNFVWSEMRGGLPWIRHWAYKPERRGLYPGGVISGIKKTFRIEP